MPRKAGSSHTKADILLYSRDAVFLTVSSPKHTTYTVIHWQLKRTNVEVCLHSCGSPPLTLPHPPYILSTQVTGDAKESWQLTHTNADICLSVLVILPL